MSLMDDVLTNLFKDHERVTIPEVMAYFRIVRSTVRKKMEMAGIPNVGQGNKHLLTREQVRRMFPD